MRNRQFLLLFPRLLINLVRCCNLLRFFGSQTTIVSMLAMDNPMCAERFYLDPPGVSNNDTDQSWRKLSSNDPYDVSNVWSPPTSTCGSTFSTPKSSQDSANWKDKPVEQWSADEVTLWICSLMNGQSQSPFDTNNYCPAVNVAAYLNLTGAELLTMSNSDMQRRDSQSGSFVYLSLQNHLNQMNQFNIPQSFPHMDNVHANNNLPPQRQDCVKQEPKDFLPPPLPSLDLKLISFDAEDHFDSIKSLAKDISNVDQLVRNLQAMRCPDKQRPNFHEQQLAPPFPNHGNGFHPQMNMPMKLWGDQMPQAGSPMVSPGSDGSGTNPDDAFNGSYYQNEVKGNHLWEFIRDLLFDSRYNPSLVKWEDREEGIFKFVKSDQVAKLWGKKKNNPAMTYEKLSRAMRYYYRRKILERIDGRRLVYKFGSMATGWKA